MPLGHRACLQRRGVGRALSHSELDIDVQSYVPEDLFAIGTNKFTYTLASEASVTALIPRRCDRYLMLSQITLVNQESIINSIYFLQHLIYTVTRRRGHTIRRNAAFLEKSLETTSNWNPDQRSKTFPLTRITSRRVVLILKLYFQGGDSGFIKFWKIIEGNVL